MHNEETYSFQYTYDLDGRIISIVYPDGFTIHQEYNGEFISVIKDSEGNVFFDDYSYNTRGQVTSYTTGDGNISNNTFDENGYLSESSFGSPNNRKKNRITILKRLLNLLKKGG